MLVGVYDGLLMRILVLASCNVAEATPFVFWSDTWNVGVLKWKFPQLFSFAKNQKILVESFLSQDVYANFSTPLTVEGAEQWIQLSAMLHNMQSTTNGDDHWSYIWGSLVFTPNQHTRISRAQSMLILFSNGYGKLVVEASINSSTGCSSVTD
jgi:hypothetical protein